MFINKSGTVDKATLEDKLYRFKQAIKEDMEMDSDDWYWYVDSDEDYVYVEKGYHGKVYRYNYTDNGTKIMLDMDSGVEVVKETNYMIVEMEEEDVERSLFNRLAKSLTNHFSRSQENTHPVIKQFDIEKMQAIEPLYIVADGVDLVGDTYTREDAEGMVLSLNKAISENRLQAGLFHKHKTTGYNIEKAWINEVDCEIGGNVVPEGMPLAKVQFHNQALWEKRKSGELMGLSIGARATEIEEL